MKFGKEFKKQKVPEWTEAYVDYNGLKRVLQEIRRFKQSKQPSTPLRASRKRLALDGAFDSLHAPSGNLPSTGDIEDQVIAVNMVCRDNSRKLYNTTFLMSSEEGGESEIMFFKKLDDELNKVNTFYKDKVEEVNKEAASLNKQMEAMIALRIKVENPDFEGSHSLRRLYMDIDNTTPLRITSPSGVEIVGIENRDSRIEEAMLSNGKLDEPTACALGDASSTINSDSVRREEAKSREPKPDPLDVLDRVKINNTLESPMSTIKSVLNDSKEKDLSFNKEELRKVEGRLKLVFIEFYRKLRLLKHYRLH